MRVAQAPNHIRTIAAHEYGYQVENFEYAVSGAPCECTLEGDICVFPTHIHEAFPRDTRLTLGAWLDDFMTEFTGTMQVAEADVNLIEEADDLEVRFDPSQLRQVVWNLCDNALKYGGGRDVGGIEIKLGRLIPNSRPYLEVADRGPGRSGG